MSVTNPWMKNDALNEWLANGERGVSSETIVMHLTGRVRPKYGSDVPHDPADFRRCERLLRQVPLLRLSLPRMAELGPAWAALVRMWDVIVATAEEEAPGCFEAGADGSAPRTYELIKACRAAATA